MKFLHISDLHLGIRVHDFSMISEQEYILNQFLEIIINYKIDAVLIAGDIYDKMIPPVEAVKLFDWFLTELTSKKILVFIISGNHDSAERVAFGSGMLQRSGLHVSPVFNGGIKPITVADEFGEIGIYLMPFLKPATVRHYYPDSNILTYQDAVKCVTDSIKLDMKRRSILVAHQFVTGAIRSESEEISVGGLDQVDVSCFNGFDYVALGHIHRPQSITKDTIRYSGTPLKYSLSEVTHQKTATIIDVISKENIELIQVQLRPMHDMRTICGKYMDITSLDFYKDTNTDDYIFITLYDEEDIPDAIGKLRAIYPNLMRIEYDNIRTRSENIDICTTEEKLSPIDAFKDLYKLQNNQDMTEKQELFVTDILTEIWEGEI